MLLDNEEGSFLALWLWIAIVNTLPEAATRVFTETGSRCPEAADFNEACMIYHDGVYTINSGCDGCQCPEYTALVGADEFRHRVLPVENPRSGVNRISVSLRQSPSVA